MIQGPEIRGQLVAFFVFLGNLTMLLPFGACYPQDKVIPPANMPKNVKEKMRGQRTWPF